MNVNEIFEKGVTPVKGEYAGKRFRVESINKDSVTVREWDTAKFGPEMKHGQYKVWEPEKTLFEDHDIEPTWGNLKKAVEAAGLSDDTKFAIREEFLTWGRNCRASFSVRKPIDTEDGVQKKFILVE